MEKCINWPSQHTVGRPTQKCDSSSDDCTITVLHDVLCNRSSLTSVPVSEAGQGVEFREDTGDHEEDSEPLFEDRDFLLK